MSNPRRFGLQWRAVCAVQIVNGAVYSWNSAPPSAAILAGRTLRTIEAGDLIKAADVGGGAAFEKLAAADAIAPEGSGDARVACKLAANRREANHG